MLEGMDLGRFGPGGSSPPTYRRDHVGAARHFRLNLNGR